MARQKDFFKKLPTAKAGEGGSHFAPDHHFKIAIVKCVDKDGRDDDYFIVEGRVLESDCPKQQEGYCASQVVKLSRDTAAGNVANFLRAAYGVFSTDPENGLDPLDPEDDDDWEDLGEMYNVACGEDNVLSNIEVYLKTTGIITDKGKGHPFTVHKWSMDRPDSWPEDE
jgi:hypothetical protein